MAAPERKTIDYFPHHVNDADLNDALDMLDVEFKGKAYSFYYKMLEKMSLTEGHILDWNNQSTRKAISNRTHMNDKNCSKMLARFAECGLIDAERWSNNQLVASFRFLNVISGIYKRRKNGVTEGDTVSNMYANCTTNKIKENKRKENNNTNSILYIPKSFTGR